MSSCIRPRPASSAMRQRLSLEREDGFTLIELLVVVIIIGILAAIAIPVYLGVQNNAKDAAVKTDVTNAKTALLAWSAGNNGDYPAQAGFDPSSAGSNLVKFGWAQSTHTSTLAYTATGTGPGTLWCVLGTSVTGKKWAISTNTVLSGGANASACPANL